MPLKIPIVAKVAMKEGTNEEKRPLMAPQNEPNRMAAPTPTKTAPKAFAVIPETMAPIATIDPTDRSISAVEITIAAPIATKDGIALCDKILAKFAFVQKYGVSIPTTDLSASRQMSMMDFLSIGTMAFTTCSSVRPDLCPQV